MQIQSFRILPVGTEIKKGSHRVFAFVRIVISYLDREMTEHRL